MGEEKMQLPDRGTPRPPITFCVLVKTGARSPVKQACAPTVSHWVNMTFALLNRFPCSSSFFDETGDSDREK